MTQSSSNPPNSGRVELKPQQKAAVETRDVSVVVSAGAGCGKTLVLTERFLSHLEPGPGSSELHSLVAITFTEKAAAEMRDRIRKVCLKKLRGCDADQADHWLAIVRSLDSARISTIHGFCSALIRSNAVEAAINPGFGLLDETLGGSFLRRSVESGVHKLLADGNAEIAELVFEFDLAGTIGRLMTMVGQRYRIDSTAWDQMTPEELARKWEDQWTNTFVPKLLKEFVESSACRKTLELLREHEPSNATMQERRRILLELLQLQAITVDPAVSLETIRENARVQGGGGKKCWDNDEELYAEIGEALTDLRDEVKKRLGHLEYDPQNLQRGAEIGLCLLRAARLVGDHYDEDKRAEAVLDFDDLLLVARNLLRDHPDVRRRAAAGISLLMVDEFQDTDPIQYEIVQMLCGDDELTGRLFVVGDAKQSIYRFRRADPRIFHELQGRTDARGRLSLTKNFRSQPAILNFVNAIFDGALQITYEPLEADSRQLTKQPCIEFLFASAGPDDPPKENADVRRRREGDWIARRLRQLLDDGVPRIREKDQSTEKAPLRPVHGGDIVILFRAMTDVRYYEEALREQGLAYYVVGGRAFFAQQEVFDVINLCQHLDNIDDEVALVGVLRSPFFSLSDDAIVALGHSPAQSLAAPPPSWLSEPQQELIRFAGRVLAELRHQKDRLPIARLLNLAIERTGYDAALLTEFLGPRKLANLDKLIDMARQFDQSGLFTLADFVVRLRDAVAEEVHEPLAATQAESSGVIRLMSIHQSKGLEFPVVVLADMDRKVNSQPPAAYFDPDLGPVVGLSKKFGVERDFPARTMLRLSEQDEDLAESRRLLYVATTRAEDWLILSANWQTAGRPEGPWLRLIGERFDLLHGQPRQAPVAEGVSILAKYSGQLPEIFVHQGRPEVGSPAPHAAGGPASISLSQLQEKLDQATPAPLPQSLQVIPPDLPARRRFSVSAIETIDRLLHSSPSSGDDHAGNRGKYDEPPRFSETPFDLSAAEKLGTLVHQVLERLDFAAPGELPALIERCAAASGESLDGSIRTAAATCISNLLDSPLASELASACTIHREIDFSLHFPVPRPGQVAPDPFTVTGTIDCLFESTSGGWIVLDYKTGARDHAGAKGGPPPEYEIQLGLYAIAAGRLLQRLPERIELAFLRHGVDRVPFEPTEARLADVKSRVARALDHATGAP